MPGAAAGSASERLIVALVQTVTSRPSIWVLPEGCNPTTAPEAASSSAPLGEGYSVSGPTTFTSPAKAVLRRLDAATWSCVAKKPVSDSASRIHGWK
jgi:hypothetical protein